MSRVVTGLALAMSLALGPGLALAITSRDFPGNTGNSGETFRFRFANPHTNGLPIYGPGGAGVTYIFRVFPRANNGYYTTFF
jgi:hypothetical protein